MDLVHELLADVIDLASQPRQLYARSCGHGGGVRRQRNPRERDQSEPHRDA